MTIVELEYPKIERIEGDERYAKFACEPLPPGYGTTLGNSLRRVLLSSLPGAAITAARVRGVAHEFSTIPGVKEDVVQIVLNLKQIRLRSFSNEPVTLTIEKEGPGVATAADIITTSEIEIVNPEAPIATLEPEASLWMELTIETGRGFHSAERREGLPIGVIPIDALYSPVKKVNFAVENTRVAQGSQILVQQFSMFAGLTKTQTAIAAPDRANGSALPSAISDMPIEDLDLPQRAFNSLKRHGITKVGQLLQTPDEELLRMRNFGKKSLDEIKERLAARGLIEAPVRDESATDDLTAEGGSLDGGPSDDVAPDDGEDETPGSQES